MISLSGIGNEDSTVSTSRKIFPAETLSPISTLIFFITPSTGVGTSIAAFSDSRTIIESSGFTLSPTLTQSSMTSTSSASPKSGIGML